MRISSRGTVSVGPVGALFVLPFLVAFWLAWAAVMGAVWLVAAIAQAVRESRAAPRVRPAAVWPHIGPSGR